MKNTTYSRTNISAITLTITAVLMLTQLPLINQTRAVCNPPPQCKIVPSISPDPPPAICVGETQDFYGSYNSSVETFLSWTGTDDKSGEGGDVTWSWDKPGDKTIELKAEHEAGCSATCSVAQSVVEVGSLKAEDNSDSGNSAETTTPSNPQTLYIPYTEDDSGYSTTEITLTAAPEPDGEFPEEYPAWTLDKPSGSDSLPEGPGKEFTYTAQEPGEYKFTAKCGNELTVEVVAVEVDLDVDSDNDGTVETDDDTEDSMEEESPGKIVAVNGDNDDEEDENGDGEVNEEDRDCDNSEIDGTDDKSDMAEIKLNIEPDDLPGESTVFLQVSNNSRVRIFNDEDDSVIVGPSASDSWDDTLSSLPLPSDSLTFRAEGVEPGEVTVSMILKDENNKEICRDEILLTVIAVGFQNVDQRNLDPLDGGQFPNFRKCLGVEHDENAGELDFETENHLNIEPATLSFDDIKDAVSLKIEDRPFDGGDSATIQEDSAVLDYDDSDPGDLNIYAYGLHIVCNDTIISDRLITVLYSSETATAYNGWVGSNAPDADWFDDLPPVYAELGDDNSDPEPDHCDDQYWKNDVNNRPQTNNYHYDASWEMRSDPVDGHGHQACYDDEGDLVGAPETPWDLTNNEAMETLAACGTADLESPGLLWWQHENADVKPFVRAAQLDGNPVRKGGATYLELNHPLLRVGTNLRAYFERRPPETANNVESGTCIP